MSVTIQPRAQLLVNKHLADNNIKATTAVVKRNKGGQKPGQRIGGRKKGIPNRKTTAAITRLRIAGEQGELPHEFLWRVARGEMIQHGWDKNGKPLYVLPEFEDRIDAANKAAPYFAPRLATIEVIHGLSDADLDAIISGAAAEAGVTVDLKQEIRSDGIPVYSVPAESPTEKKIKIKPRGTL